MATRNIATIDIARTNCSLAYVTASGHFDEGPELLLLNTMHSRVPAAILFTPDGVIDSFGYDAIEQYSKLDDERRLKYAYFKINLLDDEVSANSSA